ncbi:hypothetical protein K432DRAFT_404931 [Lepidopterella palustris CBS 459.81]|uniref:Uncharacterized protein n=1 Tax=Lepidopterella palustris CBS 459.81 TaxID=1314670 RepID=A0A8E2E9Y7_9PEZI|nr:hypothetical protein K432DRAFT_404931 [Lepidopterella palustris CBS 459.81]
MALSLKQRTTKAALRGPQFLGEERNGDSPTRLHQIVTKPDHFSDQFYDVDRRFVPINWIAVAHNVPEYVESMNVDQMVEKDVDTGAALNEDPVHEFRLAYAFAVIWVFFLLYIFSLLVYLSFLA